MTVEEPSPTGVRTAGRKPWGLLAKGAFVIAIVGCFWVASEVWPSLFPPPPPPAKSPTVTAGMTTSREPPLKPDEVTLTNLPGPEIEPQDMPAKAVAGATGETATRKATPISAYNADTPRTLQGAQKVSAEAPGKAGEDDALAASLRPSGGMGGTVAATLLPHPKYTIRMGTDIACQIDRDINSQRPGIVKCIVPFPVRGSDKSKSVVLLDRYTEIVGQQRGVVAQGQNRIDFLFTRACTPDNVCVELNSPAGDEMGAAGVPGDVDNHVWSRIGLAMFLSVIEQAPQAAAQAFTGGGGNTFLRFGNGGQSVASQVLQNQINIPPEITRPRGAWITITAARDLYFPMYDVEVKR